MRIRLQLVVGCLTTPATTAVAMVVGLQGGLGQRWLQGKQQRGGIGRVGHL